ncbi:MAG TPA: restriction endonuclease [Cryomorphaceae bacterium]|nr:restriction endonuclease [Cryomorphaceae bacterium]
MHKGEYAITPAGRVFMGEEPNEASAHIDVEEGLVFLLYRLSIHGRGKRSTFHEEWKEYLLKNSNYRTRKTINTSLSQRLRNLVSRGLANREGNQYSLSEKGQHYLQNFDQNSSFSSLNEEEDLSHQIDSFNQQQRDALYKRLQEMDPIRFEHTIKDLLLALGYEDVVVTSPTNDKGVDVTGTIQKGISSIKEVIQVKRNTTAAVSRRVMDGLRGSLYRFDAFQGTIITLSDFTKGTVQSALDRGAAPITLINGQKLLDLLIENGIGINRHKAEFFTVDPDYFTTEEVDDIEDERE